MTSKTPETHNFDETFVAIEIDIAHKAAREGGDRTIEVVDSILAAHTTALEAAKSELRQTPCTKCGVPIALHELAHRNQPKQEGGGE
jgi:hypothetical protein